MNHQKGFNILNGFGVCFIVEVKRKPDDAFTNPHHQVFKK